MPGPEVLLVLGWAGLAWVSSLITPLELRQRNTSHSVMVSRDLLKKLGSVLNRLRGKFDESDIVPIFIHRFGNHGNDGRRNRDQTRFERGFGSPRLSGSRRSHRLSTWGV